MRPAGAAANSSPTIENSTATRPPESACLAHARDPTALLIRAIEDVAAAGGNTLSIAPARLGEALTGVIGLRGLTRGASSDELGDCGTGNLHISHRTDSNVTDMADLPVVYRFAP